MLGSAVALVASVSLVVVPVGLWLRGGRAGGGPGSLLLGAGLSCLPLALFGSVLKSTTHHRALGGATFAVVAAVLLAFGVTLSLKAAALSQAKTLWPQRVLLSLGLLSVGVTLAILARGATSALLDALLISGASAATGLAPIPASLQRGRRSALLLGWAGLLLAGALAIRSAPLAAELSAQAPVAFAALSWLGAGS